MFVLCCPCDIHCVSGIKLTQAPLAVYAAKTQGSISPSNLALCQRYIRLLIEQRRHILWQDDHCLHEWQLKCWNSPAWQLPEPEAGCAHGNLSYPSAISSFLAHDILTPCLGDAWKLLCTCTSQPGLSACNGQCPCGMTIMCSMYALRAAKSLDVALHHQLMEEAV